MKIRISNKEIIGAVAGTITEFCTNFECKLTNGTATIYRMQDEIFPTKEALLKSL